MEILYNCLKAFLVGGIICIIGQLFINYTKFTPARILVTFVISGIVLEGLGIYKPLVEFAGAGATIPLTGFGYLLAEGVKISVEERGIVGVLTGGLTASAAGLTASIVLGVIISLIFKPGDKT
ncbi:MAG: stage V sporulation protein AE [Oscillospiraceae bacterium]|nr:stage V sporulation protein AE [Oscillospiraceae bacterium]